MQVQQKLFNKIVFTLLKSFHNAVFIKVRFSPRLSVALLIIHVFLCSVFKVQTSNTLVVENSGIEPLTS